MASNKVDDEYHEKHRMSEITLPLNPIECVVHHGFIFPGLKKIYTPKI